MCLHGLARRSGGGAQMRQLNAEGLGHGDFEHMVDIGLAHDLTFLPVIRNVDAAQL
jgi:hypothetical protein